MVFEHGSFFVCSKHCLLIASAAFQKNVSILLLSCFTLSIFELEVLVASTFLVVMVIKCVIFIVLYF